MRVCLMVEGQEDVTWEQWLGLAAPYWLRAGVLLVMYAVAAVL